MSQLDVKAQPSRYRSGTLGGSGSGLASERQITQVQQPARFVSRRTVSGHLGGSPPAVETAVLDALGCVLGALDAATVRIIGEHVRELGGAKRIGAGRGAPDRLARYNGALVRYLDFNDSFRAPEETCDPSDNLAPLLAAPRSRAARTRAPVRRPDGPGPGRDRGLIDLVWPRCVSRECARLAHWARELAPGDGPRRWFDHVRERFAEFRARYRARLVARGAGVHALRTRADRRRLTILYAARHPEHNDAVVLGELVRDG